jgi:ectonucleotide pyrophosphatase/phosphodiesterase family member 5
MHPIFFAHGPAFKQQYKIETFNNVDIYPLMCKILDVQEAPNNGSIERVYDMLMVQEIETGFNFRNNKLNSTI